MKFGNFKIVLKAASPFRLSQYVLKLIDVIKELKKDIQTLRKEVNHLQKENEELKKNFL